MDDLFWNGQPVARMVNFITPKADWAIASKRQGRGYGEVGARDYIGSGMRSFGVCGDLGYLNAT